jgi:glycosyltransferase involved in cell wall biosynthesis
MAIKVKKICIVVNVPATINAFLKEHILMLSEYYNVTVVTSVTTRSSVQIPDNVKLISLNIERDISIINDIKSLLALNILFRKEKFNLVLSVTPKAGLLSALAGCFARVKHRTHWFTGQVWVTQTGFRRGLLKSVDKLLASCISDALIDSQSQFDFLINENILKPEKGTVLGSGSICGVNLDRFKFDPEIKRLYRQKIGLTNDDKVLLFLGRLNSDKGVLDLVNSFHHVVSQIDNLHLVLVGPDEQNIEKILVDTGCLHEKIHFIGSTTEPEKWMSIADLFCLPSYREGFGSSVIEAAAIGLPAITSRIYGLTDAVIEGETGLMHQVANIEEISNAIKEIVENDTLRKYLGKNARKRVVTSFSQKYVSNLLLQYVNERLK